MDFLLELIFEVILEGSVEASTDQKVPLIIRIILAIVLLGICSAYLILFGTLAVVCWKRGDIAGLIIVSVIGVFFAILFVYVMIKKYKEKNKK